MPDANRERLLAAAGLLEPMLEELVFVGGIVAGCLVTDTALGPPRITKDVDAIAAIHSYAELATLGDRLRQLGFTEDSTEGAPICRWIQGVSVGNGDSHSIFTRQPNRNPSGLRSPVPCH